MKYSVRQKLTQLVCLGLSVMTLSTSIPTTSLASSVGGNGGGTGSGGSFTQSGGGSYFSLSKNIGYRFTIVDGTTGAPVSKVRGSTGSLDVLWSDTPPASGHIFTNSKFENISEKKQGWWFINISDALDRIGVSSGLGKEKVQYMPAWVDTSKILHGEDFKRWMVKDGAGAIYNSTAGGGSSSGSGGGGSGGGSKPSGGGGNKSSGSTTNKKDTTSTYNKLVEMINSGWTSQEAYWNNKEGQPKYEQIAARRNFALSMKSTVNYYMSSGQITGAQFDNLISKINNRCIASVNKVSTSAKNSIRGLFDPITAYASELSPQNTADAGSGDTTSSENSAYDPSKNGWAAALINMYDTSGFILDLDGTKFELGENGKGLSANSVTPLTIMQQYGYKLIVEPIMWGRVNSASGAYSPYIYGTTTNWVQFSSSHFGGWGGYTESGGMTMRYTNMLLPRGLVLEKDDLGLSAAFPKTDRYDWNTQRSLMLTNSVEGKPAGMGIHIYTVDESAGPIHTWDKETYPETNYKDGPAPDASDNTKYPIETDYADKSKDFKIVKYYECSFDGGETFIPLSYHGREGTPHVVSIDDEPEFKVAGYFTSTKTESYPKDGSDIDTVTYDKQKGKYKDGKYEGNTAGVITIAPKDEDKVLHVLLRQTTKEDGPLTVIKVYEKNGSTEDVAKDNDPVVENGKYVVVTPDGEYKYIEHVVSKEDPVDVKDWNDVPDGKPGKGTEIPVTEDDKTIYIKYEFNEPIPTGLVLHENEISKNFSLSDLGGPLTTNRVYPSVSSNHTCDEIVGYDEDDDPEYCGDLASEGDAGSFAFQIKNGASYNTDFVYKWVQRNTDYSGDGHGAGGWSETAQPDMSMTLTRSFSPDKVTLYPKMNNDSVKSDLSGMQINTTEKYIPYHTRYGGKSDMPNRETWYGTFFTDWQYQSPVSDPTVEFVTDHGEHDDQKQVSSGDTSNLNNAYSKSNNTTIYGLWGKANDGIKAPSDKAIHFDVPGAAMNTKKLYSTFTDTSKKMQYYPFYAMLMETLDTEEKKVMLTSENLSQLMNVNRVDVSVCQDNGKLPMTLDSYQWSIHAKAQNLLNIYGVDDRDSLLPSGGLYQLKMTEGNGVWVKVRTYQTVMADSEHERLVNKADIKTETQGRTQAEAFRQEVKKTLDNYEVVLLAEEGLSTDTESIRKNGVQITGKAKSEKFAGATLASDEKYTLENRPGQANSSDLDILGEVNIETVWRLSSDELGNVKIEKNGTLLEEISKTQKADKLLANPEVKELNDRTNVVTNFVDSIDRNLGKDRGGNTWYNEGFSIGVYENDFAFKLGFGASNPVRSAALNIKMNGKLSDRSDMFNPDDTKIEDKARTFQFKTSKRSTLESCQSKKFGYIGSFEGMDIIIPNIEDLFYTKLFYTSNTTVTDNN